MTIEWIEITDGCEAYNGEQWLVGKTEGGRMYADEAQWDESFNCHFTNPTHYAPLTPIPEPAPKSTEDMNWYEYLYVSKRLIELGESEFPVNRLLDECIATVKSSTLDARIKSARIEYKKKSK